MSQLNHASTKYCTNCTDFLNDRNDHTEVKTLSHSFLFASSKEKKIKFTTMGTSEQFSYY